MAVFLLMIVGMFLGRAVHLVIHVFSSVVGSYAANLDSTGEFAFNNYLSGPTQNFHVEK